ncbi:MAG: hypothetical protein WKF75_10605 [Singulisphaera sp.]
MSDELPAASRPGSSTASAALVGPGLHAGGDQTARRRAAAGPPRESSSYDGMFEVPTFEEVVQLSLQFEQTLGRPVGIYPETKHPTYHDSEFGRAFGPNYLERELVRILDKYGLNRPDARVFIQSFEVGNLKYLNGIADVALVQLFDEGAAKPYDFVVGDPRPTATW